jgi:predicted PurR-regulated permease PerM
VNVPDHQQPDQQTPDEKPPGAAAAGPPATTPAEQSFARRALIAVGVALAFAALAFFLWYSMRVLLLAFAAVLVGVLLRGVAESLAARTRVPVGGALIAVVLALLGALVLLGVFAAPALVRQAEVLADRVPEGLHQAEVKLRTYTWGRRVLGEEPGVPAPSSENATPAASQPAASQPVASQPTLISKVVEAGSTPAVMKQATRVVNGLLGGVVTVFIVLVTGLYLAAQPGLYVKGLVMLAPHARRPRYREILSRLGYTLRWWMIGQLVPMAVIGTLTAVGLKLIGVPMWLFLGLLAGLFNFIPNFGPLISGVPAFLLALSDAPAKAGWVVLLYIVAQSLEGYVLTPLVQRRAVEMPPALLILFQVLAGLLLGALGVVLAAPLLAVVLVAIKMLYVEDVLGDDADVPGGRGEPGTDGAGPAET